MIKSKITAAALGVAMMLPMTAGASTLDGLNTIVNGGSYDMIGGPYFFGESFRNIDVAGTRSFKFVNHNAMSQNLELTVVTVNALAAKFIGGISFKWMMSGLNVSVPASVTNFSGNLNNMIGAGMSDTLLVSFGDPAKRNPKSSKDPVAHFDVSLDASPVPLPAGGLLLAGTLAGIAALRRRKSV